MLILNRFHYQPVITAFYNNIGKRHCFTVASKPAQTNLTAHRWCPSTRILHTAPVAKAKLFVNNETNYAYNFLPSLPTTTTIDRTPPPPPVTNLQQLEAVLECDWRSSTATKIVAAFVNVQPFCTAHDIDLSDRRFDRLVDGLMDHCERLSDNELLQLLWTLTRYPQSETITSHNFHDVWSCLDDICCWKMNRWDVVTLFRFADVWFAWNLGRVSDFLYEILNKSPMKVKSFTKNDLVRLFFYINVCRKYKVDFDCEYAVGQVVRELSVDELAIIAMGFFKSQSKIKLIKILETMMDRVIENSTTIHEISLTAIIKILRFSTYIELIDPLIRMLDKLTPEIDRLSHVSCLHLALVGTNFQVKHEPSLVKTIRKFEGHIHDVTRVRLKDIERLLLAATMFNITSPIYQLAYNELHMSHRWSEIVQYPNCLPRALHFLSHRNIYSYELMDHIMNGDFIVETFGKQAKCLPRELFALDCSIDVDCPDYRGNRLEPQMRYKAMKWFAEYAPTRDQYKKPSAVEKLFMDIVDHLSIVLDHNKDLFLIDHVLPHFYRADIILCRNLTKNQFVKPWGFDGYVFGDVKRAPISDNNSDKIKWLAIMVLGWNLTIKQSTLPLGSASMKLRQLKTLGYQPVTIVWSEFMALSGHDKVTYITNKLNEHC